MSLFQGLACVLSSVLLAGCSFTAGSKDEVARSAAPSGDVDGIIVETNGGATTSFGYEVHVVERGGLPRNGSRDLGHHERGQRRRVGCGGLEIVEEGLPVDLQDLEQDGRFGPMTLVRVTVMPAPLACAPRRGMELDCVGSEHRRWLSDVTAASFAATSNGTAANGT